MEPAEVSIKAAPGSAFFKHSFNEKIMKMIIYIIDIHR